MRSRNDSCCVGALSAPASSSSDRRISWTIVSPSPRAAMSVNVLALALGVPATRIHEIVKERRSVTADTAERLARYFGGDAESWMSLQAAYDLKTLPTRGEIRRRVEPRAA